jgi:predicted nucleotidyltransferase
MKAPTQRREGLQKSAHSHHKPLIAQDQIQACCDAVAREFRPQRIVLFGSYAYGQPTPDSDVDLLVILPFHGSDVSKAIQIRSRLDAPFPLDVLVRKPEFIAQRLRERDMFIEMVMTQGRVVYERVCTKAEARRALKTCRAFREEARPCLGLPPN